MLMKGLMLCKPLSLSAGIVLVVVICSFTLNWPGSYLLSLLLVLGLFVVVPITGLWVVGELLTNLAVRNTGKQSIAALNGEDGFDNPDDDEAFLRDFKPGGTD